jgi:polyvinyl alcohol dehydrogenase (cytochrome)
MSLTIVLALALGQAPATAGAAVFDNKCATCHTATEGRTPSVASLRQRTPEAILQALLTGPMRQQGSELSDGDRRAVAEFLGGRALNASASSLSTGICTTTPPFDPSSGPRWTGWSGDITNTRFQPAADAGLTADETRKLTLKWAFGFPNAVVARALPTVAGGRLFVGSSSGTVYALDAKSGCIIWTVQAKAAVRTGIVIGPRATGSKVAAYFGDVRGTAYGVDAATGEQLWTRTLEDHKNATITGTPTLYDGRLYVPVSSTEEIQGNNASYECCTFRGSIVAVDASNGALIWKTYTISAEAKPIGKNNSGTTRWGPSGAGIWSSPTVDAKRHVVYGATGNMYTEPQQPTSDAIMAFDLDTGAVKWTSQVTAKDIFLICGGPTAANCPPPGELGPDFDFGNAPILVTRPDGKDLIVAGQKSGIGWAFDPDKQGAVLWQYRAGKGSALGGIEFGSAVDQEQAYFAVSDTLGSEQPGGLHAVELATGERKWFAPPPAPKCPAGRGCNSAILAAITVIPGVVFTGSNDGAVRGWSTKDGSLLWEYDTNHDFETVNGVPAKGASISGPGPTVVGGMLYINSGYGTLGGRPGNVLLAFGVQ